MPSPFPGIYDAAGYEYHIYSGPPEPSLPAEDAAWCQQFLPAAAGQRP